MSNYHYTGLGLQPVLTELNNAVDQWNANSDDVDYTASTEKLYDDTVNVYSEQSDAMRCDAGGFAQYWALSLVEKDKNS